MRRASCPLLVVISLTVLWVAGCQKNSSVSGTGGSTTAAQAQPEVAPDTLLESAVSILQATKPNPQAYQIAAQRLNQYLAKSHAAGTRLIEPLGADLKRNLATILTSRQLQQLESEQFDRPDSLHLETCFLNRDIVSHITAGIREDLPKAEAIFDWVVRNVQLVPTDQLPRHRVIPRLTIILGLASEQERAWTFMELLRQAGIESVLLGYHDKDPATKKIIYVPLLPAAMVGDALYLFDTTLGLPVPGPDGKGISTLRQVFEDPALLTAFDLDSDHPYRFRPEHLSKLVTLFESSPAYYAPRMKFLQQHLSGRNRTILWSDLEHLAAQTRKCVNDEIVQDFWDLPAMVNENSQSNQEYIGQVSNMAAPYLMIDATLEARLLHLRGDMTEAVPLYLNSRVPLRDWLSQKTTQTSLYRIAVQTGNQEPPAPEVIAELSRLAPELYAWVREDSTYFLGLAKFEQREYEPAADWLGKSYLEKYTEGKWVSGAHFNLGRCAEAMKDNDKAIQHYTMADLSPQAEGNLLRARRLGWKPEPAAASPEQPTPPTDSPAPSP